jgi:hypothetical protein
VASAAWPFDIQEDAKELAFVNLFFSSPLQMKKMRDVVPGVHSQRAGNASKNHGSFSISPGLR